MIHQPDTPTRRSPAVRENLHVTGHGWGFRHPHFHKREDDFLRFTTDLRIPPTSNQAERDLRPSKIQENISGRLTELERAKDRYLIRGVLSTAAKHAVNPLTVLRDAFTGTTWLPPAARA